LYQCHLISIKYLVISCFLYLNFVFYRYLLKLFNCFSKHKLLYSQGLYTRECSNAQFSVPTFFSSVNRFSHQSSLKHALLLPCLNCMKKPQINNFVSSHYDLFGKWCMLTMQYVISNYLLFKDANFTSF
jgi:hypothetical protein